MYARTYVHGERDIRSIGHEHIQQEDLAIPYRNTVGSRRRFLQGGWSLSWAQKSERAHQVGEVVFLAKPLRLERAQQFFWN